MKAVVKSRPKPGVEVKDVPIPKVADDEVLIKVKAAAICGSDLGIYNYTAAYIGMRLPVVMGHEFAGEIVETGKLAAIGEELADVLCYALAMANELKLDVSTAVRDKIGKNALKYPASEYRGRFGPEDPSSPGGGE